MLSRTIPRLIVIALVAFLTLLPWGARAAPVQQYQGAISSPRANAVLRGQVSIEGTANHPEFWKYEVRVAPGLNPGAPDDQWIRVQVREQAVTNGQLAVWDTTRVPDGAYTLRLRVVRRDGNWQDFDVLPINVANAAPPTPTDPPDTPTPADSPTPAASPTAETLGTPTPGPSATPLVIPTLTPSESTTPAPDPLGTSIAAAPPDGTPTAIVIDQPTIIVPTPSTEAAGGTDTGAIPTPIPQGESALPGLPDGLDNVLDVAGLTSACFTGATLTLGIFLVIGLLYLLKSLLSLFR